MNFLITKIMTYIGINKAIFKLSMIVALTTTFVMDIISKTIPENFLGITIFLWLIYSATVFFDWVTGISASKIQSKREGRKFVFDRTKSLTSFYKQVLFIIIIAFIYQLQQEVIKKEFSDFTVNSLTGAQIFYFVYSMITEFISIEDNRFKINKKRSRISNLLNMILDTIDKGVQSKMENIMDVKNEKETRNKIT